MNRDEHRRAASEGRPPSHAPYRGRGGATNADALADLSLAIHGLPERGALYHLTVRQSADEEAVLVGEFLGFVQDRLTTDSRGEIALAFELRRPGPDRTGTIAEPLVLWPLDIADLVRADPGDSDSLVAGPQRAAVVDSGRPAGPPGDPE